MSAFVVDFRPACLCDIALLELEAFLFLIQGKKTTLIQFQIYFSFLGYFVTLSLASFHFVIGVNIILSSLIIFLLCLIVFVLGFSSRGLLSIFILLIVSCVASAAFLGLMARFGVESASRFLLVAEMKTILIVVICTTLIFNRSFRHRWVTNYFPYIFLALYALLRLQDFTPNGLGYLRNFATPALIMLIGLSLASIDHKKLDTVFKSLTVILFVAASIEYLVGTRAWLIFLASETTTKIKGPTSTVSDFFGISVPRILGLAGNPIIMSFIFGSLAFWHFCLRNIRHTIYATVPLLFTFGKAGMLMFLLSIIWYFTFNSKNRVLNVSKIFFLVLLPFPFFSVYSSISSPLNLLYIFTHPLSVFYGNNSAISHGVGAYLGIRNAITKPLGSGTGSGGNLTNIFEKTDARTWISSGSESSIGVLGTQLGLFGILMFYAGFVLLCYRVQSFQKEFENLRLPYLGVFYGWISACLFSENALGPSSSLLPIVITCVLVHGRMHFSGKKSSALYYEEQE